MARKPPAEVLPVRLVFLGAAGVGKTALIRRFLHDAFEPRHRRTVEELHVLELDLEPQPGPEPQPERRAARRRGRLRLRLELLDTSGSYSFPAMRRLSIRHGDAFALVCSPHEPGSFEAVERLRREILEAKRDAPLVVAANKSDLGPARGGGGGAAQLAETVEGLWGARFVQVSAKQDHNVAQLFRDLLAEARLPSGSLSPALRRRSNPEIRPKETPAAAAAAGRPVKRPSCAIC